MEQKLKDYTGGKIHYTPIANIIMNNRSKNWYAELGKYITEILDIEKIPTLSFLSDRLKEQLTRKNIITKIKDFISPEVRTYESISIFFLTSSLDEKSLENMFGKPLLHDEFGEGFDGEYDEETDEELEPEIKESYASYFVNVGGTEFHIGYDHRGTGVEIQIPNKFNYTSGVFTDDDAKKCFESLKKLVDLYKLKN
jgi:uncharacterized lipoprotein YehR (DUF1307 family)